MQFRLVGEQVLLEKVDGLGEQRAEEALTRLRAYRPRAGLSTDAILALCRGAGGFLRVVGCDRRRYPMAALEH